MGESSIHWGFPVAMFDSGLLEGKCIGYLFALGPKFETAKNSGFWL